jgi:ankyrin repeat protein
MRHSSFKDRGVFEISHESLVISISVSHTYFSEYPLAMTECFRLFLEHNIDPNFQDQQGMPLIAYAVQTNKYQILCLLLFVNCDINILYRDVPTSMNYYQPLYYACARKELRFIKTLLAAGCNFHPFYETV